MTMQHLLKLPVIEVLRSVTLALDRVGLTEATGHHSTGSTQVSQTSHQAGPTQATGHHSTGNTQVG